MANARGLPDVIATQPDMQNLPEHLKSIASALKSLENSTDKDWKTNTYSDIIPKLSMQDAFLLAVYFMQHHYEKLNGDKDKEQYNMIRVRSLTKELYRAVANKLNYDPTNTAIDTPHEMNVLNWYVYHNAPKSDNVSQESNAIGNIYFCFANNSSSTWLNSLSDQQLMTRFKDAVKYSLPDVPANQKLIEMQKTKASKKWSVNVENREGHFKKMIWEIEKWRAQREDTLKNHILNASVVGDVRPDAKITERVKRSAPSLDAAGAESRSQKIRRTVSGFFFNATNSKIRELKDKIAELERDIRNAPVSDSSDPQSKSIHKERVELLKKTREELTSLTEKKSVPDKPSQRR